jgi:hypothetical protein
MPALDSAERTGVLVVRVWVERPPGAGLRARISAQRLDDGERTTFAAHTVEAIVDVVRRWLDEFAAESV